MACLSGLARSLVSDCLEREILFLAELTSCVTIGAEYQLHRLVYVGAWHVVGKPHGAPP
jgi:hypothetical protein